MICADAATTAPTTTATTTAPPGSVQAAIQTSPGVDTMNRIARDPSVLLTSVIVPAVIAVSAFAFEASPAWQGAVNAAATAVAGAIVAVWVRSDQQLPLLTGAAQSVLALILAFGVDMDTTQQAGIMAVVAGIAGYVVRDRVTAPVGPPAS